MKIEEISPQMNENEKTRKIEKKSETMNDGVYFSAASTVLGSFAFSDKISCNFSGSF